jgi:hypothetical protein
MDRLTNGTTEGSDGRDGTPSSADWRRALRRLNVLALAPESLGVGLMGMALSAAVALWALLRSGPDSFFVDDGGLYQLVARDPFGNGHVLRPIASTAGDAYRYGRILYPLFAFVLGLGSRVGVQLAMVAINVLAIGISAAAASEICRRLGRPARLGLLVLAAPGVLVAMTIAVTEPMVLALALSTHLLALQGRRRATTVSAALLLLTREAAAVALVPLIWRDMRQNRAQCSGWALAFTPILAWWVWVRVRIGQWPPTDKAGSRRNALALPLRGYLAVAHEGLRTDELISFALAAATLALAVWLVVYRPVWPLAHAALATSAVVIVLGPSAIRYSGEFLRLNGLAEGLAVLALCCGLGRTKQTRRQRGNSPIRVPLDPPGPSYALGDGYPRTHRRD